MKAEENWNYFNWVHHNNVNFYIFMYFKFTAPSPLPKCPKCTVLYIYLICIIVLLFPLPRILKGQRLVVIRWCLCPCYFSIYTDEYDYQYFSSLSNFSSLNMIPLKRNLSSFNILYTKQFLGFYLSCLFLKRSPTSLELVVQKLNI